jgi:protocatechuate 3,4-dioxygenase beta subunit
MENTLNRRRFIGWGAGLAGLGSLAYSTLSQAFADACKAAITPEQTAGPFYPGEAQFKPDSSDYPTNLTQIEGRPQAQGRVVLIQGVVSDSACRPVVGAVVEIWQACASGRYNNDKDTNPAPVDPNFRYWGESITDTNGHYAFWTIVPGAYPADTNWMRPPHVHFKVSKVGYKELTTQMYFKGEALNDKDLILLDVPKDERASVVVDFSSGAGEFNLTLQSVRKS